jgi:hypothetical protein
MVSSSAFSRRIQLAGYNMFIKMQLNPQLENRLAGLNEKYGLAAIAGHSILR